MTKQATRGINYLLLLEGANQRRSVACLLRLGVGTNERNLVQPVLRTLIRSPIVFLLVLLTIPLIVFLSATFLFGDGTAAVGPRGVIQTAQVVTAPGDQLGSRLSTLAAPMQSALAEVTVVGSHDLQYRVTNASGWERTELVATLLAMAVVLGLASVVLRKRAELSSARRRRLDYLFAEDRASTMSKGRVALNQIVAVSSAPDKRRPTEI